MPRIPASLMLRSTIMTVSAPAISSFRGSLPHPTQPLCTLRVRRHRRLTQHSLPGGLLGPTWAGLAPADRASFCWRLPLYVLPFIFITPLLNRLAAAGLILAFLGVISISLFARWLTRRMEKRADRLASKTTTNEGVYASALEKMYRENQIPAVNASRRQPHPDLYDRMLRAGVKPDYPRPDRPKRVTLVGWLYIFAFAFATIAALRG